MKIVSVIVVLFCVFNGYSNTQRCSWLIINSDIKRIYSNPNCKNGMEMIRLYKNNQFEHLHYYSKKGEKNQIEISESGRSFLLERQTGNYTLKKDKLSFNYLDPISNKIEMQSSYVVNGGKLYKNRWQSIFNEQKFCFKVPSINSAQTPFYMVPITGEIIANSEAKDNLNIADLVSFITRKQFASLDKINHISQFLLKNLKTNCTQFTASKLINEEQLVKNILTGKDRTANSYEFATALKVLSSLAGLNVQTLEGHLKTPKAFGYEYIPNFWNVLKTSEATAFFDISLGGNWMNVSPKTMIYSHFPKESTAQNLKDPITWAEFLDVNYLIPESGTQKEISFFPTSQFLHVNHEAEIILSESPISIEFFEYDSLNNSFLDKSIPVKFNVKQLKQSNKLVKFLNLFKRGKLLAHLNSNVTICYLILPDETSENGVASYISRFNLEECFNTEDKSTKSIVKTAINEEKLTIKKINYLNDFKQFNINPVIISKNPIISEALKYYGVEEIAGVQSNEYITSFFKETGNQKIASDNNAWCSVFVGYCAKKTGYVTFAKANAKSWLKVGKEINEPQPGDIVVFWRETPTSWKGHVAIYIGKDTLTGNIICLGGNQNDKVCLSLFNTANVLGYRRLIKSST